jgi:hypothetical protein
MRMAFAVIFDPAYDLAVMGSMTKVRRTTSPFEQGISTPSEDQ